MNKYYVYIDGFNLYYGCLKGSAYKWLNVKTMVELLFQNTPDVKIEKIYYFTAKVHGYSDDSITTRQANYIKALESIAEVEVVYGHFKKKDQTVFVDPPLTVQIHHPLTGNVSNVIKQTKVDGKCFEEKGTDVNMAVQLVYDSFTTDMHTAVLVTNDTDFENAIRLAKQRKRVVVISTKLGTLPDLKLRTVATTSKRKLTEDILKNSQFPEYVGKYRKPKKW